MKEVFKDIENYEGLYQVSNYGRVKSLYRYNCLGTLVKGRTLKPGGDVDSYLHVVLCKNGVKKTYLVHRLVALMFLDKSVGNGLEVNHKNGDKRDNKVDNKVDNLEWVSSSYNSRHTFDVLGYKTVRGSKHGMAKLDDDKVREIKRLLKEGMYSQLKIGGMFGVGSRAISKINSGHRWVHML